MKLSIITINYNNKAGLQKTIDSVIPQTYKDFEWIIMDGGSTDGSKELIEQYSQHITYWVSEPDNGIYHALNKGILQAKGDYLIFMNSGDTFYNADTIYNVFLDIEHIDADIIYGNTIIDNKKTLEKGYPTSNVSLSYLFVSPINHQSMFIKRELQIKFPYDEKYKYAADRKFLIMSVLAGATFHYINMFIAIYDFTGLSSCNTKKVQEEHKHIIDEIVPKTIKQDIIELYEYRLIKQTYPILSQIHQYLQKRWLYLILFQYFCKLISLINKILPSPLKTYTTNIKK